MLVLIARFLWQPAAAQRDALEIGYGDLPRRNKQVRKPLQPSATSQTTQDDNLDLSLKPYLSDRTISGEKTWQIKSRWMLSRNCRKESYGVLSYSYDETVSVWGNGAEDCLLIHDGDREYKVDVLWQNMYSAPLLAEAADYDEGWRQEYYISTIQGTGTGVYVEGLYYRCTKEPEVSGRYTQVVEDFDRRILGGGVDEEFLTNSCGFSG